MELDIPNEAEPWETLDLYTWNDEPASGSGFLPVWSETDDLVAQVATLPTSVMVMQSGMVQQRFATEAAGGTVGGADVVLTEVAVPGMLIGTLGGLTGDAAQLPVATANSRTAIVPVVRNWIAGRDPNWALVSDMLTMEADRTMHVNNLVGLTQGGGYTGLVLDYRAVPAQDSATFALFVKDLATALHAQNLWLAVVVDTPVLMPDGSWNTAGYDWSALERRWISCVS
jgi:spore germination protein YaaH